MKIKIKKNLQTVALIHYATEECTKLFAKHCKYFGGDALKSYFNDYNNGNIDYEQLVDNVFKDVTDYESAL